MADLGAIEIPIVVRDNQLKSAVNTTNRLERELTRLVKAVDSNSVSEERYRQTLIKVGRELKSVTQLTGNQAYGAVVRYTNAKQKQIAATARAQEAIRREADEQRKAAAEQKRVEQATRENTIALNRMRAAYDGSFAVEQRTLELKRRLRQEIANGNMTLRQAGAELLKYRGHMQQFNMAQMAATKSSNRYGVVTQQAGYQIGDFLVQVQSGTNFMVAFGQQATQLVGILPLLAPPAGGTFLGFTAKGLIGLSAGLGIAIPLLTALGAAFMRTRGGAEETTDAIGDLVSELNDYKRFSDIARSSTEDLREEFGDLAEEAQALAGFFQEATVARAIDSLSGSISPFSAELSEAAENAEKLAQQIAIYGDVKLGDNNFAAIRSVKELAIETAGAFGLLPEQVIALQNELNNVQSAGSLEEIRDRSLEALQNLQAMEFAGGTIPPEIARIVQELEKVLAASARATAEVDDTGESAKTLRNNIADTVNEAIRLRDVLNQVASAGVSMTDRATVLRAQIAAARAGQNVTGAGVRAETAIDLARGGATADQIARVASEAAAAAVEVENLENTLSELLNPKETAGGGRTVEEINELQQEIDKLNKTAAQGLTPFDKYNKAIAHLNVLRAAGLRDAAYSMEIERLNDELAKSLPMVNDVADAFGDFLARGMTDFKSFANSIFKSFQNMLAQMIATAARNRILISLGATGSIAGPASAASNLAQGAGVLGGVGTFASSIGTGLSVVGNGFMAGGLSGAATATAGAVSGGIGAGGAMGFGTAIGAALPVLAAVAVAVALFRKKTKELDSGLNVTVKNMDALVTSFKTVETSRFFGLSKKTSTSTGGVSSGVSDPIVAAVQQIQQSVLTAAEAFGFGADAFDNFSYEFKLSLKGLSEEQQMQKINEELTKMGDSFASLTGHFSSMNELLEAAEQRYQIENRVLQALGNSSELLARSRERELAATHALNRGLLQATFNLEDANAAVSAAMDGLRRAIDAEKAALQTSFDAVFDGLRERLDLATEAVSRSRNIFNMLSNSLKSRSLGTMEESMFRRSSALSFLQSGDINDEVKLENALRVVSEPSEGLFTSFVDYAREFLQTSRVIGDLEKTAAIQLSADEKAVVLLEQQIEANKVALETQLAALDQQYQIQVDQFNALLGIDTSVKSVGDAIATLRGAIEALASAQAAAKAAQTSGGGFGGGSIDQFSTGTKYQGFDLLDVGGAAGLLQAAGLTGVSTSGKTGLQIAQDIANATGQAVQLDAASRVQQFARGGMFDGGMRLVGEEGPELEVTGPSRIYSKQQTKELLRGGDSNEGEGLRNEVSELRQELRQLLIANNKYTKRSYDLYNKWDIDGLPAERT